MPVLRAMHSPLSGEVMILTTPLPLNTTCSGVAVVSSDKVYQPSA